MAISGRQVVPAAIRSPVRKWLALHTGLVWAFALGHLIWGDSPDAAVIVGAAMIVTSGLLILVREWRPARVPVPGEA